MLLILVAGNETTRNLIGNGMLALLRHPDQLRRLRDAPELLEPAVDELLRYDSPVQLDGRVVREDLEMGGKRLRAGQKVIALLGAANRDPAAFDNPDALDIGRGERSHLSFGRGIHYCLGASLALLEARIAFRGLLDRFPVDPPGGRAPLQGRYRPSRRGEPVDRGRAVGNALTGEGRSGRVPAARSRLSAPSRAQSPSKIASGSSAETT